jgi:hypothetical protein
MDEKSIGFFVVSRSFVLCKRDRERERENSATTRVSFAVLAV